MGMVEATEAAIKAATHLTSMDAAAVEAVRVLAHKIDTEEDLRDAYLAWQEFREITPAKPLQLDNVSVPTFLKYCESLGLTPAGREKLTGKKPEAQGGKLSKLRSVPKPA